MGCPMKVAAPKELWDKFEQRRSSFGIGGEGCELGAWC